MPKVSVVILNWNGKAFLTECLKSFKNVTYPSLEIIVVDNNSTDGSQEYIRKHFPSVRLIANKENCGFAQGNNIGWKASRGKYILFLNNDTVVTPQFLDILVSDLIKDPRIGCIQPQMRVTHKKHLLDTAGSYLTFTGFLYHYGYRKPYILPMYQNKREMFSAKGACMLIPQTVMRAVNGFDDDFFIFFEETDLCHRIWLAGYTVVYEPKSSIYHVAGGDTTDTYNRARRIYLTFKNMNYSYLKNFGVRNLCTVYPVFILMQLFLLWYFLFTGKFSLVRAMMSAYWWNISHFSLLVRKRRQVQTSIRKISDGELNRHIIYNPNLYYYYCLLFHAQKYKDTELR